MQPFGLGLDVALVQGDLHPHGLQALQVLVDGPGPDGAAAGQGDAGLAGPGHQRPQDQDRGPHGLDRFVGGHPAGEAGGIHHQGLAVFKLDPHEAQEFLGGADVGQGRHVVKPVHPRGQQRRRDDGQGGVLGPADRNFPVEGHSAFNDDFVHVFSVWVGMAYLLVWPASFIDNKTAYFSPFLKAGRGDSDNRLIIPLNPPLRKGDLTTPSHS